MPKVITESEVEEVALDILADLGYKVIHGPHIAPFDSAQDRPATEPPVGGSGLENALMLLEAE